MQSFFKKHFQLIVFRKLLGWKLEKSYAKKVYMSPRPPPKISLKHDWKREMGSEVAQRSAGQVVQQFKSSQSNQPNPNPDHDRTGQPVVGTDRTGTTVVCRDTSHAQGTYQTRLFDDSKSFNVEDKTNHDRTEKPVVCRDASHAQGASQTRSSHESTNFNVGDEKNHDRLGTPVVCRDASHAQSMLNEVDIDFRIPGLPHSVVKQAENSRVRELVKKIENHPHRQSLQRDLQQNKSLQPRSVRRQRKWCRKLGNVTIRSWATIWKFPIEPTNSKSKSWENGETCYQGRRELCKMREKRSVPQEIDVNSFHEESVSSERKGGPVVETSVIQARSSEDSKDPIVAKAHWENEETRYWSKHRKCARQFSNTFCSWKRNVQRWR